MKAIYIKICIIGGDLKDDRNFIKFIELYSSADYFQLVEGDKNYFYGDRPANLLEFF